MMMHWGVSGAPNHAISEGWVFESLLLVSESEPRSGSWAHLIASVTLRNQARIQRNTDMWCGCVCVHRFWARFRVGAATDRGYLHTSFMAPPARCITHKRADAKSASAESDQHNRFRLDFQQWGARSHARLAQSLEVIAKVCCFFFFSGIGICTCALLLCVSGAGGAATAPAQLVFRRD